MMELLNVLQQEPWLFTCLVFVFSLIIGSFLNVIIYRLPIMMEREWRSEFQAYFQSEQAATPNSAYNLAVPRSACPICNTPIAAKDNIPLFSWLLLKGRCRHCQTPISIRYPAVELLTAILSTVLAWQFGPTFTALLLIFLTWGLIALSFIDIDKMLLPDQLTLPLLWLVLLFSLSDAAFITPAQAIIGAAVGYLSLWCVYWAFKLLTGKEGMGYGDFKLLAIFGALLGWQQLILIILLSSVVGAIIGASLLALQGKDKATPIPFGPYIAVAGWVAIIGGEQITKAYLGYIGL
jgi:leader peptidase (prepilin peptidase) / N-methyltransferase